MKSLLFTKSVVSVLALPLFLGCPESAIAGKGKKEDQTSRKKNKQNKRARSISVANVIPENEPEQFQERNGLNYLLAATMDVSDVEDEENVLKQARQKLDHDNGSLQPMDVNEDNVQANSNVPPVTNNLQNPNDVLILKAKAGDPDALYKAAQRYETAPVPNLKKAIHCYRIAAGKQHLDAMFALARLYAAGKVVGVVNPREKGIQILRFAASKGHLRSQEVLTRLNVRATKSKHVAALVPLPVASVNRQAPQPTITPQQNPELKQNLPNIFRVNPNAPREELNRYAYNPRPLASLISDINLFSRLDWGPLNGMYQMLSNWAQDLSECIHALQTKPLMINVLELQDEYKNLDSHSYVHNGMFLTVDRELCDMAQRIHYLSNGEGLELPYVSYDSSVSFLDDFAKGNKVKLSNKGAEDCVRFLEANMYNSKLHSPRVFWDESCALIDREKQLRKNARKAVQEFDGELLKVGSRNERFLKSETYKRLRPHLSSHQETEELK